MSLNPVLAAHYGQLLGLTNPWRITDIEMQIAEQRVDITIEWPEGKRVRCPECDTLCALKDHRDVRTWRHLDIMQFQTFLHCRVPRAECRTHGARTIDVPWSKPHSRWTLLYEAFAVPVIEQVPALTKVATLAEAFMEAGYHERIFVGSSLPSGVYYYVLMTPNQSVMRIMTLVK